MFDKVKPILIKHPKQLDLSLSNKKILSSLREEYAKLHNRWPWKPYFWMQDIDIIYVMCSWSVSLHVQKPESDVK